MSHKVSYYWFRRIQYNTNRFDLQGSGKIVEGV